MSPSYLESLEDNIKIDKNACVFCGNCADRCILDNIRLKLSPCRQACPLGVNVQGYVQLILRGKDQEARDMVREKLPFPQIICRICDHPCEKFCEKGKTGDSPVNILALKRYLFDSPEGQQFALPCKGPSTHKHIAVIGAGPAGITAAYDLALKGHAVTLFDAAAEPGGLLQGGIPAFRLSAQTVREELSILSELGINLRMNCQVGSNVLLKDIMAQHDAVILATGLHRAKTLGVPGEGLNGVLQALPFLQTVRAGSGQQLSGHVLVVGGGNTAIDTAMVALRQGADQVSILTLESENDLPSFKEELDQACAEGVHVKHSCGIAEITGKNGRVSAVVTKRCTSVFDADGRFAPVYDDVYAQIHASFVIVAIGQERDASVLAASDITIQDVFDADPLTLQCGQTNVFVAGDVKAGGSVIKAMASGREAAISASRHVLGEHLRFERGYPGPVITEFSIDHTCGSEMDRIEMSRRAWEGPGDSRPLDLPLSEEDARKEAARCHSCGGPYGKHRTCWFCLPCEVDCPEKALWVDIPYLLR